MQQVECDYTARSFCSALSNRTTLSLQSFDWHWNAEKTKRKWKFHFSPPALEVKPKTSPHPTLLPIKAKSKDVPTAVILKSDHMNIWQAKSQAATSALVPGIAQRCGTRTLASQDPAATIVPGQQDMKSPECRAGVSQYSIHKTFIQTSLVLQCLSIHSLLLF